MAKVYKITHTSGKVNEFTEGDYCKAIGTSGMAKDQTVKGTLTTGNFNEFCLINDRGIPCSINDRTLVKTKKKKGYYVTKKRVEDYLKTVVGKFKNHSELLFECKEVIKDLELYPQDNKNQIRFFKGVEKVVTAKIIVENLKK